MLKPLLVLLFLDPSIITYIELILGIYTHTLQLHLKHTINIPVVVVVAENYNEFTTIYENNITIVVHVTIGGNVTKSFIAVVVVLGSIRNHPQ